MFTKKTIMKKLLFILIVFNLFSINAQTWKYSSSGNDFDGRYKSSLITGNANNYPYNKPTLVINYFDKDDSLNFYISDAGYYSDSSDVEVLWVFNNEKDIIYKTSRINLSSDGKSIFLKSFSSTKSDKDISIYEFINKLKTASSVSVRILGKFDKNDIKFSLNGSTKAINYVISAEEIDLKTKAFSKRKDELIKSYLDSQKKEDSLYNDIRIKESKLRVEKANESWENLLREEERKKKEKEEKKKKQEAEKKEIVPAKKNQIEKQAILDSRKELLNLRNKKRELLRKRRATLNKKKEEAIKKQK